jgi:hypothetical protein
MRNIWQRKSGVVSTTIVVVVDSTKTLERNRLSFGLVEVHTAQEQPIIGMPVLVPVPRNVIFNTGEATTQI